MTGSGPVIAPADRADVPGVIALIGRVYAEYGFVFDPPVEVPDLLAFERHYEPPRGAFFVVRQAGSIVGSVGVERLDGATAELHRLYLDAPLRGRGTGRGLVEEVLAWCRTACTGASTSARPASARCRTTRTRPASTVSSVRSDVHSASKRRCLWHGSARLT